MTPAEQTAWLRLAALPFGPRRKQGLLASFGSPEALWAAEADDPRLAALRPPAQAEVRAAAQLEVQREVDRLAALAIDLVPLGDPAYPPLLAQLPDAPVLLFVRGQLPGAEQPCLGLVGTRRANAYGSLVAETLARELAGVGVGVISGLAAGIDAAAHRGALRAGGYTGAVLGTGVDRIFPSAHAELANLICAEGGLISEFTLGARPLAWHFPARNRIIAGLSLGIVVVQAPTRSGALLTAQNARAQGKAVLAVPGQITDARHAGCHTLLRDGARLVRDVDDILEAVGLQVPSAGGAARVAPGPGPQPAAAPPRLSTGEQAVLEALGLTPVGVDDLLESVSLSAADVQSALLNLEIGGLAARLPGNRYVRAT